MDLTSSLVYASVENFVTKPFIQKLFVARWRASPNICFDKSFSKILCSDVASHLLYADLETYV